MPFWDGPPPPKEKACVLSLHVLSCLDFCFVCVPLLQILEQESLSASSAGPQRPARLPPSRSPEPACWACWENSQTRPSQTHLLPSAPAPYSQRGLGSCLPDLTLLFGSIFPVLPRSLEEAGSQHTMLEWYQRAQQRPRKDESYACFPHRSRISPE